MTIEFINEQVDFLKFPKIDTTYKAYKGAQFTFGDIEGNAIKLLYLLIKHGIATNINKESYDLLVKICNTPINELTSCKLSSFKHTLSEIKFNKEVMIRILGGVCASAGHSGNNDYFTLQILSQLAQQNVPVELVLSKNDLEFIEADEKQGNFKLTMMAHAHAGSMSNLQKLVDKRMVSLEDMTGISFDAYKPALKAISYSLNQAQTEITLYSNMGIDQSIMQKIAKKLEIPYADNTVIELARTIEAINAKFQDHVKAKTAHLLYDRNVIGSIYYNHSRREIDLSETPFELLLWRCNYHTMDRTENNLSYKINYVQANESTVAPSTGSIYNLGSHKSGQYIGLYSNEGALGKELFTQLNTIKIKAETLRKDGHIEAAGHADKLWTTIKIESEKYFNKTIDKDAFRTACITQIDEARKVLGVHRGWKQVLGNVGLALAGLGIGYVVAGYLNKKSTGNFMFFGPEFPKRLDVLEDTITQLTTPTA